MQNDTLFFSVTKTVSNPAGEKSTCSSNPDENKYKDEAIIARRKKNNAKSKKCIPPFFHFILINSNLS